MSFELSATEKMFAEAGRRLMAAAVTEKDYEMSKKLSTVGSKLVLVGAMVPMKSITIEDLEMIQMLNTR